MKSIKPGRGPSKLGAIYSYGAALFGVFWCILAFAVGAWFMVPFGIIFIVLSLTSAKYDEHNATAKDRYSIIDIVDDDEEKDPLNEKYECKKEDIDSDEVPGTSVSYCPYCGNEVKGDFDYCPKCGKKLPD